jgi:Sulfotransferase domain
MPFNLSSSPSCLWCLLLLCSHSCSTVEAATGFNVYRLAQAIAKLFIPRHPQTRPNLSGGDGIKVVEAGCGRSGRLTPALVDLGYYPFGFWDAFPIYNNEKRINWDAFLDDDSSNNKTLLIQNITAQGFNAVVGFPGCLLYKELMTLYPDAKIILSVRRSDTTTSASLQWADDTLSTVIRMVGLSYRKPFTFVSVFHNLRSVFERWIFPILGVPVVKFNKGKFLALPQREPLAAAYDEWVTTVQQTVPPNRLLIHSSKDGWKPLCDFLSPTTMNPIVIKTRCKGLASQQFPTDGDVAQFITVVAVMTMIAKAYDQIPLFVLLVVGLINGMLIFTTSRKNRAKEKSE